MGIEELVGINHNTVKEKIRKKAKLRKLLESELSSKNMMLAIDECVMPNISYCFGIINWLEGELKQFDTDIRKMLHLYKMIQIKNGVDRLYGARQKGGQGMMSVWDSFKCSAIRIAHAIKETDDEVLNLCGKLDQEKLFFHCGKVKEV